MVKTVSAGLAKVHYCCQSLHLAGQDPWWTPPNGPGCTAPLAGPSSENWPLAGNSQHQLYQHQLHQITSFPICLHPRQRSLLKSCRGVGGFDTHHADIRAGANGRDRRFDTHFADNTTSAKMHTIGFIFTYLLQTATAFSSLNRSMLKYLYLGGTRKDLRISSFPHLSYFI